ncbi:MAG TPA: pyridoxamine 5'-phosphate oxidase family protein [Candidatus Saccharibacteria bacterium]|nr:pyridoxamine 5'-phosphate oxidase family protein [Candidatus Saccharibacteria bacterium]
MTEQRDQTGWAPTRDELNDWLREQELCVFSSLDATGAPMSATVSFSVTKEGDLLIGTDQGSRKSHNVDGDSRVAMTITDSERRVTCQLQGNASKLSREEFETTYAEEHYRLRPKSLPFKDVPGQCHILIKPTHIKFSDVRGYPWLVTEF